MDHRPDEPTEPEAPQDKRRFNLLFVCTGNTCRSPMAEVIARRALAERGWSHVEVRSAGVGGWDGSGPSGGAVRAAARSGLDLSAHEATYLSPEVAEWADLILTMSPSHVVRLAELGAGERTALLPAYAAAVDGPELPAAVSDPIGGPDEEYFATFDLLGHLIHRVLQRLEPVLSE